MPDGVAERPVDLEEPRGQLVLGVDVTPLGDLDDPAGQVLEGAVDGGELGSVAAHGPVLPASAPFDHGSTLAPVSGPLTTLDLRGTDTSDPHALRTVLPRPKAAEEPPIEQVRDVIDQVRVGGDDQAYKGTLTLKDYSADALTEPVDVEVKFSDAARVPAHVRDAVRGALGQTGAVEAGATGTFARDVVGALAAELLPGLKDL